MFFLGIFRYKMLYIREVMQSFILNDNRVVNYYTAGGSIIKHR